MDAIRMLLDTVALHRPTGSRALIISGDIGVGKSRLLAEMVIKAQERAFQVLEGRVYESGGQFPYLPFIEALRPVIRSMGKERLRALVGLDGRDGRDGRQRGSDRSSETGDDVASSADFTLPGNHMVAALARLFPALPDLLDASLVPETLSQDQEKFRLFDAIATLLERIAESQPLLLSIDNLQWADSASMELTMYLTLRLHSSRVALVGVTRPPGAAREHVSSGAPDAERATRAMTSLMRALGELVRQGLLMLLPLSPLSKEAAEQHLHALLPGTIDADLVQPLLLRADGNPFFLEELARTLTLKGQLVLRDHTWYPGRRIEWTLPPSISLAVEQRLQELSQPCLELLRVAALFGRTFQFKALVQVMQSTEAEAQRLIDEAEQAGLLATNSVNDERFEQVGDFSSSLQMFSYRLASDGYIFNQGIVEEVLSSQLPASRASRLHGSIGNALEPYHGRHVTAAELARHFVLAGAQAGALRWSIRAGQHAIRQQAYREAIGHFRIAARLMEDQGAAARIEEHTTPADLLLLIGQCYFKSGELPSALHELQHVLELQQPGRNLQTEDLPPLLLAQTNRLISDIYRMQGKYELALSHLQAAQRTIDAAHQADRSVPDAGHATRALNLSHVEASEHILLLQAQGMLDLMLLQPVDAEKALWESHQLAAGIGDRESQAFALHLIGWIRGWGTRIYEAIRLQEQAHALFVAIGDPFRAALVDQGLGIIYQALGEMERAKLYTLRALEQARRYGIRPVLGWLYWNQGIAALVEGNWAGCKSYLQQAMQEAEATENTRLKPVVQQTLAELHFRKGDWHQAEHLFQDAIRLATGTEWYQSAMALYGHFLAVTGRREAAKSQLERTAALPDSIGYSGHFYIPFLAEGFLHLGVDTKAVAYIERIRSLRGLMYYGLSVDRVLGEVAAAEGDWGAAQHAFVDGLAFCKRVHNQPEEAAIYYEQARMALLQSSKQATLLPFSQVHALCEQARAIFLSYEMSRAVNLVDTLQEGIRQLERQEHREHSSGVTPSSQEKVHSTPYNHHLELALTKRELDVMRLVAEGHTDREVADTLVISHRTVNRHLSNIFVKLDVPGRAAAVAFAIRQGLVG